MKLILEFGAADAQEAIKTGALDALVSHFAGKEDTDMTKAGNDLCKKAEAAKQQVQALPQEVPQQIAVHEVQKVQAAVPTTAPSYTHDDLAKAAITLMDAGKQPQLLSLLGEFGVQAVPQLPADKLGDFAFRLREMGAEI